MMCEHGYKAKRYCPKCNNARTKRWRDSKRELALKLIGDKCIICGSTNRICFHEKHGKRHKIDKSLANYINNPKDYIPLCYFHHKIIHSLIDASDVERYKILCLIN